ncbi:MAG: aminoacyl-tRNA hydrolase [bacterium]|nr:aminoacyl-tRNA hydrolase [bacterium]
MITSKPKFKLIIGLGNPDAKYKNTYHNVGHLFVDYLDSRVSKVESRLLKSDVYMNESGSFVKKEMKKSSAKPEELLVIHDDSDITVGNYKLSFDRGAAGHHGIESIQATIKTNNFWRLRIGIRPAKEKVRQKSEEFVLKKISSANKKIFEEVFEKSTTEII